MLISVNFLFRIVSLLIFFLWWAYWQITERQAEKLKPKTKKEGGLYQKTRYFLLRFVQVLMILQVAGFSLLPLPQSFFTQSIGMALIFIGSGMAFSARKTLGANWSHAFEYQIKRGHELVTHGIYAYVRHPIYAGLCFGLIGGELVAQSYLVIASIFLFFGGYYQARQEEKILTKHFGFSYTKYMKRTKMFIPYLW